MTVMKKLLPLYTRLDRAENALYKAAEALGATLLATAFISIFTQVAYRYLISKLIILPVSWTEELSRYCLFWIVYIMLPLTLKQGLESANTFFTDRLPTRAKLVMFIIIRIICLSVAIVAFKYSFVVLKTNAFYSSPAMELPAFFLYGPVTIGMGLVLIRYLIEAIGLLAGQVIPFANSQVGGAE